MFNKIGLLLACMCVLMFVRQVHADVADPTRPLGYGQHVISEAGAAPEPIILSSILVSSNRKIAIINGQQLHENEVIKGVGAQIKRIDADAVTLQQGQKVWRLPLNETVIRK